MKISLSLWDIGGQERWDFLKSDFFKGTAVVALVFDLSRPETFEKIDSYYKEIREKSGEIPIVLVGNKNDLKEEVGETIPRDAINHKVSQYNMFEYIETSALKNKNVNELFNRLSIVAVLNLDTRPRLGEIVCEDHFRFKVLLVGSAAVGKSSLIRAFVNQDFKQDYKLTVGLDFMTHDFEIPNDDLPLEAHSIIKSAIRKAEKTLTKPTLINTPTSEGIKFDQIAKSGGHVEEMLTKKVNERQKVFTHKYIYLALIGVGIVVILAIFVHFLR